MKKTLITFFVLFTFIDAYAECVATTQSYVSCKPGYYLGGTILNKTCVQCPVVADSAQIINLEVFGSSPDYNTGGQTSCFAPAVTYKDDTGEFEFTEQCNYSSN